MKVIFQNHQQWLQCQSISSYKSFKDDQNGLSSKFTEITGESKYKYNHSHGRIASKQRIIISPQEANLRCRYSTKNKESDTKTTQKAPNQQIENNDRKRINTFMNIMFNRINNFLWSPYKEARLPESKDVQDMDRSCLPRDNVDSASCTTRHWSRSWNFRRISAKRRKRTKKKTKISRKWDLIKDEMHGLKEKEEC